MGPGYRAGAAEEPASLGREHQRHQGVHLGDEVVERAAVAGQVPSRACWKTPSSSAYAAAAVSAAGRPASSA